MAKLSKDQVAGTLHPRETLFVSGSIGALNSEILLPADGCASVALDLRGTFNLTISVEGTVDGVNWTLIPMRPLNSASPAYVAAVSGSGAGIWVGSIYGFRQVKARCSAWASGTATAVLSASNAPVDQSLSGAITTTVATTVGTAAAATTLTIGAAGAGLRHYLTYLSINRYAAAVLTAAATPVTVTTSNLPGALAYSFEADAAALGTMIRFREDFAQPLAASAANTATTIICPATPGVIWRVTAGYYVAP
jgi:hypothetical protein